MKSHTEFIRLFAVALAVVAIVAGVRAEMAAHYFKGKDRKLEAAIEADNGAAISQALKDGANVNARGVHGVTPLMVAVDGFEEGCGK